MNNLTSIKQFFERVFAKPANGLEPLPVSAVPPGAQEVILTDPPQAGKRHEEFWVWLDDSAFARRYAGITGSALVWGLAVLGIVLRLRQYLFDRSFWLDECMTALNIIHRSPAQFLMRLDNNQAAPLGFLLIEKATMRMLGAGEMALRLLPFLSGVAAIFLFVAVAQRFVESAAIPIAVGLFALCGPLIYYSSELKPYSSDVAVVLILYLLAGSLYRDQVGMAHLIGISVFGACALWLSYPAVFVVGGLGLSALWVSAKSKNRGASLKLLMPFTFWGWSFASYYWFSLRHVSQNQDLKGYWRYAFMPFPPHSFSDVRWFVDAFVNIFSNPVGLTLVGIAAVAAILGMQKLRADHRERFLLLVVPIGLTLLASGLHIYPFQGRLLLFVVPALILLIAAGLARIQTQTRAVLPLLAPLLVTFLFFHPTFSAARDFLRPRGLEESRPIVQYIEKHRSPGDLLYAYYPTTFLLDYYRERELLGPMKQINGVESRSDWRGYWEDLDKLRGQKRVWIFFCHVWRDSGGDEQKVFLDHLDEIGTRLDEVQATGASTYLYDLSAPVKQRNSPPRP
jgi:hypothetical protein